MSDFHNRKLLGMKQEIIDPLGSWYFTRKVTTMGSLTVTVKQKASKGKKFFEGSYHMPWSTTTKLAKADGCTQFASRSSLEQTAEKLAKNFGWTLNLNQPTPEVAKKTALKRS